MRRLFNKKNANKTLYTFCKCNLVFVEFSHEKWNIIIRKSMREIALLSLLSKHFPRP